jgi:Tfp pilus assembly protein FimT
MAAHLLVTVVIGAVVAVVAAASLTSTMAACSTSTSTYVHKVPSRRHKLELASSTFRSLHYTIS